MPCFFLAIFLHELGHWLAVKKTGNEISRFVLSPFGAKMSLAHPFCSYRKELIIYLAGSGFNFLSCAVSFFLLRLHLSEPLLFFFFSSLLLGVFNLLPIPGLDGERAMASLFSLFWEEYRVYFLCRIVGGIALLLFSLVGAKIYWDTGNFSLFTLSLALGAEKLGEEVEQKKKKATKIT
jgi:membrane-associated protease RseP (regulator of RpoE activity)